MVPDFVNLSTVRGSRLNAETKAVFTKTFQTNWPVVGPVNFQNLLAHQNFYWPLNYKIK